MDSQPASQSEQDLALFARRAQRDPCARFHIASNTCHSFGLLIIPFGQDDPCSGSLAPRSQRISVFERFELSTPVPEN